MIRNPAGRRGTVPLTPMARRATSAIHYRDAAGDLSVALALAAYALDVTMVLHTHAPTGPMQPPVS